MALATAVLVVAIPAVAPAQPANPLPAGQQGCLPAPTATDPEQPWGLRQLAPDRVWPFTTGGGVTVAVVDTGVDAATPQLAGRVLPGTDVVNPGAGPGDTDCYGHGTFVAGIIAAMPSAGTGFTGVAPGVRILPVRVANSGDDVTAGAMARGIRAGVDLGADVVNVSASTTVADQELAAAVDYAEAHDVLVVASAANSAQAGDPVTYPASYPTVIAVGAVDPDGKRADFSQTGPYLGLVAPGVDVVSIGPRGPGHWQGSGTSYAAPFVAGTAALVRAYHPELTATQVRARLRTTADHPAATLPDPEYGWGLVNPNAAVTAVLRDEPTVSNALPAASPPVVTPPDELGPILTVAGLATAAVLVFALWLSARLGPAGRRRRWRPARTVTVASAVPPGPVQRR
ncbi:type VII secretion-associated serine protease mycosin [Actinophytocola oryzae]|uniref:Type VII secretion-associated serine protease mycosin n=1 Tax=Actinophytocola oryzae TaxID=502181 RepID=A0A4R7UQM3_9PSEU|nr:type VII secretion-associated serine protease mycosin [Actinophytocola oryzae]